jgi:hypothetical protein
MAATLPGARMRPHVKHTSLASCGRLGLTRTSLGLESTGAVTAWCSNTQHTRGRGDWHILPLVGEENRRRWAVPAGQGRMGDVQLSLLDPGAEGDRHFLILAEHPELQQAIEEDRDEITLHGYAMSPRLHISMHEIVANQLWMDDPPETWQTVQRLVPLGYERHEILHMLGSVVSGEAWHTVHHKQPYDPARFRAGLAALPDSWEADHAEADPRHLA